jgi:hypothetical protein
VVLRLAVLAALLACLGGCSDIGPLGPRQPGCVVPPDEGAVLDAYEDDAVLALVPSGAEPAGAAQRSWGCIHLDLEDVSSTEVTRTFTLHRDYDKPDLVAVYQATLAREGWAEERTSGPSPLPYPDEPREVGLTYCRMVHGVTSGLTIYAQSSYRTDIRPSLGVRPADPVWQVTPGRLLVSITANPLRANCAVPVGQIGS